MAPPKKPGCFQRPFNPKYAKGKEKMWNHCIVLLEWAERHGKEDASLTTISNDTGIPRMSIRWILLDWEERGYDSEIYRASRVVGCEFYIYHSWNKANSHKRRKKIIDAVKYSEKLSNE